MNKLEDYNLNENQEEAIIYLERARNFENQIYGDFDILDKIEGKYFKLKEGIISKIIDELTILDLNSLTEKEILEEYFL